jgi:hypothetical protein
MKKMKNKNYNFFGLASKLIVSILVLTSISTNLITNSQTKVESKSKQNKTTRKDSTTTFKYGRLGMYSVGQTGRATSYFPGDQLKSVPALACSGFNGVPKGARYSHIKPEGAVSGPMVGLYFHTKSRRAINKEGKNMKVSDIDSMKRNFCGTTLKVTNDANGKSINVFINDFGGFGKSRDGKVPNHRTINSTTIIDLNCRALYQLKNQPYKKNCLNQSIPKVTIEPVGGNTIASK